MRQKKSRYLILVIIVMLFISCSNVKKDKEAEYSLLKGVNYSQQGEYGKAMPEYFKSYDINPKNIILLKEIGYNYYQFGDYKNAEKYWQEAFALNSKDEELIKNLATLYYEEKEYSKSLEVLENAYNKKDAYYQQLNGMICYKKGKLQESYYFLREIPLEKYDEEVTLTYIELLERLEKKEELLSFSKNVYPYLKDSKNYVIKYSQILSKIYNKNVESEKVLMDYILKNGSDDEILLELSNLYFKMGENEKGEDILKLISDNQEIFEIRDLKK